MEVTNNGTEHWKNSKGQDHREGGPAVIYPNGDEEWYLNGLLHREDGPALVFSNGTKKWFRNHEFHREDGPAIIWNDGTEEWYLNDREVDPLEVFLLQGAT